MGVGKPTRTGLSAAELTTVTECRGGHGSGSACKMLGDGGPGPLTFLLAISPLVFLNNFASPNFDWCRVVVARSCGLAGPTGPFMLRGKKSRLHLSSSGGGLFDGRPKTQTWVWGAFVFLGDQPG